MPSCYMLVGLPYSGKSTWAREFLGPRQANTVILSTDEWIEAYARQSNQTYNDAFKEAYPLAEKVMNANLSNAIARNLNIIWDQTNLSEKTRGKKFDLLPRHYERVGVEFDEPEREELGRRRMERFGKFISNEIYDSMRLRYDHLRGTGPEVFDRFGPASAFDRWGGV